MSLLQLDPTNLLALTADPTTPTLRNGDMYWNTTNKVVRVYDSATATWSNVGLVGPAGAAGTSDIARAEGTSAWTLTANDATYYAVPGMSVTVPSGVACVLESHGILVINETGVTTGTDIRVDVAIATSTVAVAKALATFRWPASGAATAYHNVSFGISNRVLAQSTPQTYNLYAYASSPSGGTVTALVVQVYSGVLFPPYNLVARYP